MVTPHKNIANMTVEDFKRIGFEEHKLHNGEYGFRKGFVAVTVCENEMFIGHDYRDNTNVITKTSEKDLPEWIKYFERI